MWTQLLVPLLLLVADDPTERPRHPLAPSLPQLTKEEEAKVVKIIERFILYDTGKLQGEAGKKALQDFNRLGPEAIFALIDGFNQAANLQDSCPAVIIGRKISMILNSTEDIELLLYAKETLGSGVTVARHMNVVRDLQHGCSLRRTALQQRAASNIAAGRLAKSPNSMSLAELTTTAKKAQGPQLRSVLTEAEKRQGPQVLHLLATSSSHADTDIQTLSKGLLRKHLERQPADQLKGLLKHDRPEVRAAAARLVGSKYLRFGPELIDLLNDNDRDVQQAARQSLVQIAGGVDHGPEPDASSADRATAIERWRTQLAGK